jgi:glycine cleavage system regulatory protein
LVASLCKFYFKNTPGRVEEIDKEMARDGCNVSRSTAVEQEEIVNSNTRFTLSAVSIAQFEEMIA